MSTLEAEECAAQAWTEAHVEARARAEHHRDEAAARRRERAKRLKTTGLPELDRELRQLAERYESHQRRSSDPALRRTVELGVARASAHARDAQHRQLLEGRAREQLEREVARIEGVRCVGCRHSRREHEGPQDACSGPCGCTAFVAAPVDAETPPRPCRRRPKHRPRGRGGPAKMWCDDSGTRLFDELRKGRSILRKRGPLPGSRDLDEICFRQGDSDPPQEPDGWLRVRLPDAEGWVRRFRLREALRELNLRRCAHCGARRVAGSVDLELTERGLRIKGVLTCGSVWACAWCAPNICRERASEIEHALDVHGRDRAPMLTVTIGHTLEAELGVARVVLTRAWSRLWSGRAGQRRKAALGIVDWVRGQEPMYSTLNGWHPHLHVALFCKRQLSTVERGELVKELALAWRAAVKREIEIACSEGLNVRGLRLPGPDRHGIERGVHLGKLPKNYQCKLGNEVALVEHKLGKTGLSMNPWAIAARAVAGSVKDELLWATFTEEMHGARQLVWSKGARKRFGLGRQRTDEQIAAAAEDAAAKPLAVFNVDGPGWKVLERSAKLRENLHRAARGLKPVTAAAELLLNCGLRVNETRPGSGLWFVRAPWCACPSRGSRCRSGARAGPRARAGPQSASAPDAGLATCSITPAAACSCIDLLVLLSVGVGCAGAAAPGH